MAKKTTTADELIAEADEHYAQARRTMERYEAERKRRMLDQYTEEIRNGNKIDNLRIDSTNRKDITRYPDGKVATVITWKYNGERVVTQYDTNGNATVSQELGKDDIVNFKDGLISSIITHVKQFGHPTERIETQYGKNGKILSTTTQTKIGHDKPGADKWLTTQHSTYYENGRLATVTTYQQRTKRKTQERRDGDPWWMPQAIDLIFGGGEDTAESFVSSITQYDESGKLLVTFNFHEFDEVSYHPSGRVAHILRKDKDNKPTSMTAYDENGKILNVMVYQDGRVISTTDYTNGQPTSNVQLGDEQYQNIFDVANKKVAKKSADEMKKKTLRTSTKSRVA